MISTSFNHWPIRSRIMALVALPLILSSLMITLYHTVAGIDREKASLLHNTERLLTQTAAASELAVFAADTDSLDSAANIILSDPDIDSVFFYDDSRQAFELINNGRPLAINTQELAHHRNYMDGNHWVFIKAIYLNPVSFYETPDMEPGNQATTGATRKPIGWIVIAFNMKSIQDRQTTTIINNLLITTVILGIALWLALVFSRSITQPIRKITHAIEQYKQSDYDYRIDEISGAEVGQLEQGINNLAQQVGQSQQQLQDSITEVTDLWSDAVDDLRQKNIELRNATLEATQANQAKDDFLARMSHELRTPLTAIMGFLGILEKSHDPQVRKEYIDMIAATSQVLLSTINDILDFSKLNSGGFELKNSTVDLEMLLQNILDIHALSAFKKGIELNLLIDSDVPRQIETDTDKLGKAINNIIANAIKFTENGDIIVFVSVEKPDPESPMLRIDIRDSGVGIEADHLTQLFDPFYQVDHSSTRQYEGSGLGLAITRDFVKMLGGTIEVESEINEGTEVSFTLQTRTARPPALQAPISIPLALIHESNSWSQRSWRNLLLKHTNNVTSTPDFDDLLGTLKQAPNNSLLVLGHGSNTTLASSNDSAAQELDSILTRIRQHHSGPILVAANDYSELDRIQIQKDHAPLLIIRKPLTANRLQKAITILRSNIEGTEQPTSTASTPAPATPVAPNTLAGKRILVAEDNQFTLRLLSDLLSPTGATLTLEEDGEAAWEQVLESPFDLILLDKRMPHLDGITLSQRIRQQQNPNSKTPILLLTADRLDDDILSHKDFKGINALCYKPIDQEAFFSTLQQLLNLAPTKRSLLQVDKEELAAEINTQVSAIESAKAKGNLEVLAHHCHQLHGILGMAGLKQLDEELRNLNRAIESSKWQPIANAVNALTAGWEELKTSKIRSKYKNHPNG